MSIKISDTLTLKKRSYAWELIELVPSNHHRSKGGYVEEQRWYPTLDLVLRRIFEVEIKDNGGELSDLQNSVDTALLEVKRIAKLLEV